MAILLKYQVPKEINLKYLKICQAIQILESMKQGLLNFQGQRLQSMNSLAGQDIQKLN